MASKESDHFSCQKFWKAEDQTRCLRRFDAIRTLHDSQGVFEEKESIGAVSRKEVKRTVGTKR